MLTPKQISRRNKLITLGIILGIFVILGIWFVICARGVNGLLWHEFTPGHKHLILLQNDAESRPTGGFIGAYAVVDTSVGFPRITVADTYTLENHAPEVAPEPVHTLLDDGVWYAGHYFRDANISPDFPTSAEELIRMYNLNFEKPTEFDSVWAVNYSAIENLLKHLGGITVGDTELTANNLFYTLEVLLRPKDAHSLESLATRKDFLKSFARALEWKAIWPWNWNEFLASFRESLANKDIQIYNLDGTYAEYAGALAQTDGDFLQINLSNYGGKKTDRYLERQANYFVDIDESGNATAHLTLTLTNRAEKTLFMGDYFGWLRIYVPDKITSLDSGVTTSTENGKAVLSQVVSVPVGEARSYSFAYKLPQKFRDDYSLYLSKQSGAKLNLNVDVRSSGQRFWDSESFAVRENHAEFQGILEKDLLLTGELLSDIYPPFITNQHFSDYTTLWVDTSEPLLLNRAIVASNYALVDTDEKNPQHDNPEIISIEHYDSILKIKIRGMTAQPEERYKLTFRNQLDHSGNAMGELSVTVVQRFD